MSSHYNTNQGCIFSRYLKTHSHQFPVCIFFQFLLLPLHVMSSPTSLRGVYFPDTSGYNSHQLPCRAPEGCIFFQLPRDTFAPIPRGVHLVFQSSTHLPYMCTQVDFFLYTVFKKIRQLSSGLGRRKYIVVFGSKSGGDQSCSGQTTSFIAKQTFTFSILNKSIS